MAQNMKFGILLVLSACILLVSCGPIQKNHENMADSDSAAVTIEAAESLSVRDYDRAADHPGARCAQNEAALFFFCALSTIDEPTGKTILDQEFEDPFQNKQGTPYGYTMFDADDKNLYFYFTDLSDENGTLAMLAAFPLDGSDYRILWRKE